MRLFLLPALGADERMFSFLGKLPVELVLPRFSSPHSEDTMAIFASRMAEVLALDENDMVGGVSFGGMVAAEIARQRHIRGLILISSGLSSRSVDPLAQRLGRLAWNLPRKMMRSILGSHKTLQKVFGKGHPELYRLARQMLADAPDELLVHGGHLSLNYHSELPIRCPVYSIHGENDTMMFPVEVENCHMVAGAGQGLVVTHPEEVTRFLLKTIPAD